MVLAQRLVSFSWPQITQQTTQRSSGIFRYTKWRQSALLFNAIPIPTITISLPDLVSEIWEGILKAVPKKKTSHMKKRHRQLAGKALKDVNAINSCPGCGKPKKAHTLCPYCVAEIKESWKQAAKQSAAEAAQQ